MLWLLVAMPSMLEAVVNSLTHRYELHIDPLKRRIYICELCDTASERIVSENRIKPETALTLQQGDEVDVVVDNGNPVIFKYEFGGVEAFKNADAAAVEKFFETVKLVPSAFPPLSAANTSDLVAMVGAIRDVSPDQVEAEVKKNPTKARQEVADKVALAEAELRDQGFDDDFFQRLDQDIKIVRADVSQLPGLMKQTVTPSRLNQILGDTGEKTLANSWTNVRNSVAAWKLEELAKRLKDNFKKLDEASVEPFDTGAVAIQIERYATRSRDVGDALATLIRFSSAVDALGKRVQIIDEHGKPVVLDFDTLNDRKYTVKINFKNDADGLPKDVRTSIDDSDALTGDFKIIDQPYHTIHVLGGGPAAVYSLIKQPQFSVDKSGEDLVIKRKPGDRVNGQDVAAMLNLIPTGWDDPFFAWAFQIGVTPKKDNFAAYVGTGPVFKSYFFVGAGFVVQQVNQLAPGLTVGQVVTSVDDLKTVKEYKTGIYIHLTINLGPKK
jgi:hypothetical protein